MPLTPRVCVVSFTIGFGSEHNVDLLMDLAKLGEGGKYHFLNRSVERSTVWHSMYSLARCVRIVVPSRSIRTAIP